MRKLALAVVTICIVGALAAGIFWVFVLPALEWSRMVQNLDSHAQKLKVYGAATKVNNTFVLRNITIDKSHPKFQTIIDFISRSKFIRKWDLPPPYAISCTLIFYLDDGQQVPLDYDPSGCLWWKAVYQASVDRELGEILNLIPLS